MRMLCVATALHDNTRKQVRADNVLTHMRDVSHRLAETIKTRRALPAGEREAALPSSIAGACLRACVLCVRVRIVHV
jgi:hypothetical protein